MALIRLVHGAFCSAGAPARTAARSARELSVLICMKKHDASTLCIWRGIFTRTNFICAVLCRSSGIGGWPLYPQGTHTLFEAEYGEHETKI
eukprot:6199904-Pleurochrysis_carterae.AAC.4